MTVATTPRVVEYVGNGSTTVFAVPFQFIAAGDLSVALRDEDGVETALVLTTNYTVTGGDLTTGSVTALVAPATGMIMVIRGAMPIRQDLALIEGGNFSAKSIDRALDRGTISTQELAAAVADIRGRALVVPRGETVIPLPPRAGRAQKLLGFDAIGNPRAYPLTGGDGSDLRVTPESMASWDAADATQALLDALSTGLDVSLTTGKIYSYTAPIAATADYQRIGGGGVLRPIGAIDGMQVTGGLVGVELDLTFDAPAHTGMAVRISGAHRTRIRRLLVNDVFSVLHVEGANMTTVDYCWGHARGKGLTWYGNDALRSDVLSIGIWVIDQTAAPTQYGFDWNGNCHSFECHVLGMIGGKAAIIRNTDGVATLPAIGRFTHLESDYSNACGIDIQAGLDYDIAEPYILGPNLSGIRVAATINSYEVRVTGGKSVGSTTGYGIENAGGPILLAGNTALYSNFAGEVLGNVWSRPHDTRWDDTFFATVAAGAPTIGWDVNDSMTYDRAADILREFIGGVLVAAQAATYKNKTTISVISDASTTPLSFAGIIPGTQHQVLGSTDQTGRLLARFSADNKGAIDYSMKSRGATIGTSGACQANDQIYRHLFYADTGTYMGHAGQVIVYIDGAPTGDPTEQPSAYAIYTGTGLHTPGNRTAFVLNSKQQCYLLGQTSTSPAPGTDFGANLLIGVGAAGAGQGPLKLTVAGAVLQTVAEVGVIEVDANGVLYVTNAAGKRRRIIDADTGAATIAAGAGAGTGPTIAITNGPNSGRITLTTGTTPTLGGTIATVTYANAFPADSFVTLTPANGAAATAEKSVFTTGTAGGFTVTNITGALPAGTQIIWEYLVGGK